MPRQLNGWLEHYLEYTQNSEPPTLYHVWSGITAIASALRRKCYCNWGLRGYIYPNLYVALVGPPGGRKGTAMKIAKDLVQELDIPIGSDALGSTQILYKEIKDSEDSYIEANNKEVKHKSISVWSEEFQVFLSDRDPKLISSLTDLFDCPRTWKYSTLKRGAEDLSNCWLTIIGAITPSLLQSKLSQDAVGGGLLSRIIFVVGYGPKKKVPLPFLNPREQKLQQLLMEDLQQIALLTGPFKLTKEFLNIYSYWYENSSSADGISNDKFLGYNSRRALHLNKLCMIISASESDSQEIRESHFEKALAILEETEAEMPNAFYGLGLSHNANLYAKIVRFAEGYGGSFSFADILREVQLDIDSPEQLQTNLRMAKQAGLLRVESSPTETRYEIQLKQTKGKGSNYLKSTLYRRMTK